ncbi:MAG: hypothetical protein AB7I36_20395 [Rhodospirillaceae bacterium]
MPPLTDQAIKELLPASEPPRGVVPQQVTASAIARRYEGLRTSALRQTFAWMTAMQAAFEADSSYQAFPGFQWATYGFVPVPKELELPGRIRSFDSYVFGIAVQIEPDAVGPDVICDSLEVGDEIVPLVVRAVPVEPHSPHPSPAGTGACWARSRRPGMRTPRDGVLTVSHAFRVLTRGVRVPMDVGGPWCLSDVGPVGIDAALVGLSGCIPSAAVALSVDAHPVAGADVVFEGRASGPVTARITHTLAHPTFFGMSHPMRVFLDQHGQYGDSGALVTDTQTRNGVGLYMGKVIVPDGRGGFTPEGICQLLEQVRDGLILDLFEF